MNEAKETVRRKYGALAREAESGSKAWPASQILTQNQPFASDR